MSQDVGRIQPFRRAAMTMNGITVAYLMGLVNSVLGLIVSFGVNLTIQEQAYIVGVVNCSLVLAVHLGHRLGEVVALGTDTQHSQASTAAMAQKETPVIQEASTSP